MVFQLGITFCIFNTQVIDVRHNEIAINMHSTNLQHLQNTNSSSAFSVICSYRKCFKSVPETA